MKQLFILISLLCISNSFAQTISAPVTIKAGNSLYVTINGQDYPRSGYLGFNYTYNLHDSTIGIYYVKTGYQFLRATIDTNFIWGDSSSAKVRNMNSLRTWFRTSAY